MTPEDARRFINRQFRATKFSDNTGDQIVPETFVDVLDAIERFIPFPDDYENEKLKRFLWSGCRKFNRWFVPSPFVVSPELENTHARFADSLLRSAGGVPDNAAVFLVHAVRDTLYRAFNAVPLPLSPDKVSELDALHERLKGIPSPSTPIKIEEFERERKTVTYLMEGLRTGTLQTRCTFSLPYPVTKCRFNFGLVWTGIHVECTLTPSFAQPSALMTQGAPSTVIVPAVSTRWQFGTTQVELKISALIDHSASVEPLQLPMEPLPVAGWPNIFRLAFQLVYEASWRLRDHDNYISVWVPSPSDLGDIEYKLVIPNHDDINVIRKSNPALLNIAFVGAAPAVSDSADIGTVESTEWFGKCRILAEQYLTLGDTREALFWLNVGVESRAV